MQAASDIYLGWTKGTGRQPALLLAPVRDMKGSAESAGPAGAQLLCRRLWVDPGPGPRPLGDPVAIAAYLGRTTSSTGRSPTSPSAMPTRTSATTRRSWRRSIRRLRHWKASSAAGPRVSPTSQPGATSTQTTKTSTAMIRIDQTLRVGEPERVQEAGRHRATLAATEGSWLTTWRGLVATGTSAEPRRTASGPQPERGASAQRRHLRHDRRLGGARRRRSPPANGAAKGHRVRHPAGVLGR